MSISKFHLKQQGFGMVETMIAAGVSITIALGIMKMMENTSKEGKRLEVREDAKAMCGQAQSILSSWQAGGNTLSGLNTSQVDAAGESVDLASLKDKDNNPHMVVGSSNAAKTVEIHQWKFFGLEVTGSGTGNARLHFFGKNLKAPKSSGGAQIMKNCEIILAVTYDGAGNFTGAQTASADSDNIWQNKSDGTGIYYNTAGVEIGTGNTIVAGRAALAVGGGNSITGSDSVGLGRSNNVAADSSVGLGWSNTVNTTTGYGGTPGAVGAIGIGTSNIVTCPQCLTFGYGNQATDGRFNLAIGTNNRSGSTSASTAIGIWSHVNGEGVVSIGWDNGNRTGNFTDTVKVSGDRSIVIGGRNNSSTAAQGAIAIGTNISSTAYGNMTLADRQADNNRTVINDQANTLMLRFSGGAKFFTQVDNNLTYSDATKIPAVEIKSNNTVAINQEAWQVLPLAAGWTACTWPGAAAPQYYKDSVGVVHIKGCIKRTGGDFTEGSAPTAWTLPVGYRPANHGSVLGPLMRGTDGSGMLPGVNLCYLYFVFTMGQTSIGGSGTFANGQTCHLTGISFRADG